jgi:glycosyltransferase involved in cell wall biosynthesis
MPQRRKILVAAYACEPESGSEPGVGWQMCQAIGREHDVWVVTRSNNRASIERALAREPNPHLNFAYADLPRWARFWKRGERGIHLYYYLWQFAAWRAARGLTRQIKFDLAHHVTFVSDYTFTFLGLLDVPFVWGPIGSNGKGHAARKRSLKATFAHQMPYYVKALRRIFDPLVWLCGVRAKLVIGNHGSVMTRLPLSLLARGKYLTHIAIGVEDQFVSQQPRVEHAGFSVLSMGNLLPIKGFHLTIGAFAQLAQSHPAARLTIAGDGPLRASLEALARQLGVHDKVEFTGRLPRPEALALMRSADAFLFPSSEVAGMVILEAMAHGVPVIGLRGAGVGEMVPPECGFAVEQDTPDHTVEALARCLMRLASDPALHQTMSAACRLVVRERYVWEQRHHAIRAWYQAASAQPHTAVQ